jgi:tetratricopeptide (TPR) repeat protein
MYSQGDPNPCSTYIDGFRSDIITNRDYTNCLIDMEIITEHVIFVVLGMTYTGAEDYHLAVNRFSELIAENPNSAILYSERGFAFRSLGEEESARQDLTVAKSIDEDVGQVYLSALGRIGTDVENVSSVGQETLLEYARRAIELLPDNVTAYLQLGNLFFSFGQYQDALVTYQRGLEIDENEPEVYFSIGASYERLEDYNQALMAYDKAIELAPDNPDFYVAQGTVLFRLQNYDQATIAFRAALSLGTKSVNAYYGMAAIMIREGDDEGAIILLEELVRLAPEDAFYHCILGDSYRRLERTNQAIEAYKECVSLATSHQLDSSLLRYARNYLEIQGVQIDEDN